MAGLNAFAKTVIERAVLTVSTLMNVSKLIHVMKTLPVPTLQAHIHVSVIQGMKATEMLA